MYIACLVVIYEQLQFNNSFVILKKKILTSLFLECHEKYTFIALLSLFNHNGNNTFAIVWLFGFVIIFLAVIKIA